MGRVTRLMSFVIAFSLTACAGNFGLNFESATLVPLDDVDSDGVIKARDLCADTAVGTIIDNDGCPTAVDKIFTLGLNVLFDNNSSYFDSHYLKELESFAEMIKESDDNVTIELEGYASAIGEPVYNLYLSQKRANRVMAALVDKYNVDASSLTAVGFGASNLADEDDNDTYYDLNRRVVAYIQVNNQKDLLRWNIYSNEILNMIN